MNTGIKIARYHLLRRADYLLLPWAWLAFGFAVDLVIFALIPESHHMVRTVHGLVQVQNTSPRNAGGLAGIVAVFFALGVTSVARSLPFALTLGVSRRTYYAATGSLALALSAVYGLVLTGLQAIERATNGWGEHVHIFQSLISSTAPGIAPG